MYRMDQSPMAHAQNGSLFFGIRGSGAVLAATLATLVATASLAQDAGVSGVPPGPGNVNGLNGSVRDPSGIGQCGEDAAASGANDQAGDTHHRCAAQFDTTFA